MVYDFAGLLRKLRQQVFSYHPELLLDLKADDLMRDGVKDYIRDVLLSEDTYHPDCRRANPRAMQAVFELTCRFQMEDVLPKILPWIVYEAKDYLNSKLFRIDDTAPLPPRFLNVLQMLQVGIVFTVFLNFFASVSASLPLYTSAP